MKILTKQQVILLHEHLVAQSGGLLGIRDESLLDSAVNSPLHSFDSKDLYPTLLEKATRLGFALIKNHPFVDGNKRIGTHAMLVFLDINQMTVEYEDKELIDIILSVADGTTSEEKLLAWLQNHII